MQFLLDYHQYFKNIETNIYEDDLILYKKFIKQSKNGHLVMVEGLITTHPINLSVDIINNRFSEIKANEEPDGEIYVEGEFKELYNYIPLFNNLGYFITTVTTNGTDWTKNFDDNTKPVGIMLEAKYDIKIDKNEIPKFLYHSSPLKFKHKILKNGLILKSGNKLTIHPERIYLTSSILTAKMFTKEFTKDNSDYHKDGFVIYKIDTSNIDNLYSDVNLRASGYYTTDNINKKDIEIVFESK